MKLTKGISIVLLGLVLIGAAVPLCAFESTQTEYITMSVTVGGEAPQDPTQVQIVHTSLKGISNITKLALVQGTLGTAGNLQGFNPSFTTLLNAPVSSSGANPVLRLTLRYRFVPPGGTAGVLTEVVQTFDTDPAAFLIQISPSEVQTGTFQYQLIGEKLNDAATVLSAVSVPSSALDDPSNSFVNAGIEAGAAPILGVQGGMVTIPDGNPNDGESALIIPSGVLKSPTQVALNEIALNDPLVPGTGSLPAPVALYRLDADPPFQGGVRLSLIYPEYQPSTAGWNLAGQKLNTSQLSVGMWDGFTWRLLNGRVDSQTKILSVRSGYTSYLGVFPAGAPSVESIAPPQKIITPNGDGLNDTADFTGIGSGTTVEIFDVTGHRVRTLNGPSNLTWNGRDDKNDVVESGVYIYQFSESGTRVSGVIAVAK